MSSTKVLTLYKVLIREAQKFHSYNFRNYTLRRIRDSFMENKALDDQDLILEKIEIGYKNLGIIKRQVVIGNLYKTDALVIENIKNQATA